MVAASSDLVAARSHRRVPPLSILAPGLLLAFIILSAIIGPFFTPDSGAIDLPNARLGLFSPDHLLGTDAFGRDMLARTLEGARTSLIVGLGSTVICLIVGGWLGMIAGYRGGRTDTVIMRFMDVVLAFPTLVLALTIAAFLGPSIRNIVLAIAFAQVPHYARLSRATTMSVREREFVLGSRLLGSSHQHVITRHVLPNVAGPLVVYGLLAFGIAILVEASLSFLGLGVRPPAPSWGAMIAEGRPDLNGAAHISLIPGAALFLTILSINLLADAVRSSVGSNGGGA